MRRYRAYRRGSARRGPKSSTSRQPSDSQPAVGISAEIAEIITGEIFDSFNHLVLVRRHFLTLDRERLRRRNDDVDAVRLNQLARATARRPYRLDTPQPSFARVRPAIAEGRKTALARRRGSRSGCIRRRIDDLPGRGGSPIPKIVRSRPFHAW